ncbi:trp operon leader peptide [Escherichia coli]|nr:trp operon leader peptide [Escherichia coli]
MKAIFVLKGWWRTP